MSGFRLVEPMLAEQQAEQFVHPLNPGASLEREFADEFLKLGGHDGSYRLAVLLGRVLG